MEKVHSWNIVEPDVLAQRLLAVGVPVTGIIGDPKWTRRRLAIRGGVTLEDHSWVGARRYDVTLPHGFDPITLDTSTKLTHTTEFAEIPKRIVEALEMLPHARQSLLGENRDVVAQVRKRVLKETAWQHAPQVVESDGPVPGALAVSMRGHDFTAWFGGGRFASLFDLRPMMGSYWNGRGSEDFFKGRVFDMDDDGMHLSVLPNGLWRAGVSGTVRTPNGDEWFHVGYERVGDRSWADHGGSFWSAGMLLPTAVKERLARKVGDLLEPLYRREFDAFARDEIERHQRMANHYREEAMQSQSTDSRAESLDLERRELKSLAVAQAIREGGRPRNEYEAYAEFARSTTPLRETATVSRLRVVPDRTREEERDR